MRIGQFAVSLSVAVCMESFAVRPRTYLVFGPSGSGKSSFGTSLTARPDAARHRTMKGVQFQSVRREDFLDGTPAILFELPKGESKTSVNSSAEDARGLIQSFLECKYFSNVYGVILLESLQETEIQLSRSLKRLANIFGRGSVPPVLVLMTKADIRASTIERAQSLADICSTARLPYMLWNNFEGLVYDMDAEPITRPLSEYQFEQQLSELDSHLTVL